MCIDYSVCIFFFFSFIKGCNRIWKTHMLEHFNLKEYSFLDRFLEKMDRVFRVWHGDWKKNKRHHRHFVPTLADYGFTVYMESPETYELLEATVRENYVLTDSSPVVITYGMPDWMLFPSGQAPPVTVSSTADLVRLMARRPPQSDVNLMVTIGSKSVAEYQFLQRTEFSIGPTRYVVDGTQDEREKAEYERLVCGEHMPTSETVMNEIFGEQEMLIFYRIALEMGLADREFHRQQGTRGTQQMEIINLDDDDDMVDATPLQPLQPSNGASNHEANSAVQPQVSPTMTATEAPPVMWDVGIDMVNYPEFYNNQRDERFDGGDLDFWRGLIAEDSNSSGDFGPKPIERGELEGGVPPLQMFVALNIGFDPQNNLGSETVVCDADSSTCSSSLAASVKCAMPTAVGNEFDATPTEVVDRPTALSADTITSSFSHPMESAGLNLTLACGTSDGNGLKPELIKVSETSSEGSETEGGCFH